MDEVQLELARREIAAHPRVTNVGSIERYGEGASLAFDINLDFGDRWLSDGKSPTGVFPVEAVRFDFPADFPLSAPIPSYRQELGRELAHVMPGFTDDGRPVPCLVDGPTDDFVIARGLGAFVDQYVIWLERAAANALINPAQGWEPMRRDGLRFSIILDRSDVRRLPATASGGNKVQALRFWMDRDTSKRDATCHLELGHFADDKPFHEIQEEAVGHRSGVSYAISLWATSDDNLPTSDSVYAPDDVSNIRELLKRADAYHVGYRLREIVKSINAGVTGKVVTIPFVVLFLVRRPFNLINSDSDIEIIAYAGEMTLGGKQALDYDSNVVPLITRDRMNRALLQKVSGATEARDSWLAVGAGSLGSKIALHLGRSGNPPVAVVDERAMEPHHAARQGLHPNPVHNQYGWQFAKSDMLARTIRAMNHTPVDTIIGDVKDVEPEIRQEIASADGQMTIVNTTASLSVREFFAMKTDMSAVVAEGELYDKARLGVLRIEGATRNPNTGELVSEFYRQALHEPDIEGHLSAATLSALAIGEGCSSETMVCDDAAISLQAALMAEEIDRHLVRPSVEGQITRWVKSDQGISLRRAMVPGWHRVLSANGWTVTLSEAVHQMIALERQRFLPVETGGILIGRVSRACKTLYVVDILPAPADSSRAKDLFVLGTQGVSEAIADVGKRSAGRFVCLGTWHSHGRGRAASKLDKRTAREIGHASLIPQAILIIGDDGYECLIDIGETESDEQAIGGKHRGEG